MKVKLQGILVLLIGVVALGTTPRMAVAQGGGTAYCTNSCDYALGQCGQGSTCTKESCTGVSGTVYQYSVSCLAAE